MRYNGFIARLESAYRYELYFGDDESIRLANERLQNAIGYYFDAWEKYYEEQEQLAVGFLAFCDNAF